MTITIEIQDDASKDIWQNVALSLGMSQVSDQQVQQRVGEDFVKDLRAKTKRGKEIAERAAEQAEVDAALGKIAVIVS